MRELTGQLIHHYEDVIEMINGETDIVKIHDILNKNEVGMSFCACAFLLFGEDYDVDLVGYDKKITGNYPSNASTKEMIIHLLQIRIDKLEEILTKLIINARSN